MIVTRLVPLFLFIGLSAALTLTRNPDQNQNAGPTVCGGELTGRNASIRSPGFPHGYPNNVHCEWSIPPPEKGYTTDLAFMRMDLEERLDCSIDYVEIKKVQDGEDVVLGRFCGTDINNQRSIFSKAPIKITFHSGTSTSQHYGFELDWATFKDGPACGGVFIASQGMISSPNTTDPNETRKCEWFVVSRWRKPTRFEITILSTNENPDCEHDYYPFKMQVFSRDELETPDVPLYIDACNHEKTWVVTSPGPQTRITFQRDSNHTLAGFTMSYTTVEE